MESNKKTPHLNNMFKTQKQPCCNISCPESVSVIFTDQLSYKSDN